MWADPRSTTSRNGACPLITGTNRSRIESRILAQPADIAEGRGKRGENINMTSVLILITHWADDYWYKSGEAPYTKSGVNP